MQRFFLPLIVSIVLSSVLGGNAHAMARNRTLPQDLHGTGEPLKDPARIADALKRLLPDAHLAYDNSVIPYGHEYEYLGIDPKAPNGPTGIECGPFSFTSSPDGKKFVALLARHRTHAWLISDRCFVMYAPFELEQGVLYDWIPIEEIPCSLADAVKRPPYPAGFCGYSAR